MRLIHRSEHALPIEGVELAAVATGLRYKQRDDLCLVRIGPGAAFHCLYTTNRFCAAPVVVARAHQACGKTPRCLVINAGNANAGTGKGGETAALEVCAAVAAQEGCDMTEVLPYSTGVIGQAINIRALASCVPSLFERLSKDGWTKAAAAILTTDTRVKLRSVKVESGDLEFTVTGMAKGSGMIKPNMATMLAFIATDAPLPQDVLERLSAGVVQRTFNRITVDGDTSTNDACAFIATGAREASALLQLGSDGVGQLYADIEAGLEAVCEALAQDIVRDGEGATKFVSVHVSGAESDSECVKVAYAVAESPLVKTALFASDPNWGRILAAVGRSGCEPLQIDAVNIDIGPCPIVRSGEPVADYEEAEVARVMSATDVAINISVGAGPGKVTVWTCDFSYEYVRINAEYRS